MVIPVKPAFLFEHFRNVKIYARRFKPVFNQTKLIRSKTWIVHHLKWNSGIHFRIDWRKKCWIHAQHFILICFGRMWRIPGKMWQIWKKKIYTQNVHVMFWKVSITNCITQKAHIFLYILWFIGLDLYDYAFSHWRSDIALRT